MLARRLTTILPAMILAEAIETRRIHRVAGRIGDCPTFVIASPPSVQLYAWRSGSNISPSRVRVQASPRPNRHWLSSQHCVHLRTRLPRDAVKPSVACAGRTQARLFLE